METATTERILGVIRGEIGEVPQDAPFDTLGIDSLEFISLCQTLEREFSAKLADEMLANVRTPRELVLLVQYSRESIN